MLTEYPQLSYASPLTIIFTGDFLCYTSYPELLLPRQALPELLCQISRTSPSNSFITLDSLPLHMNLDLKIYWLLYHFPHNLPKGDCLLPPSLRITGCWHHPRSLTTFLIPLSWDEMPTRAERQDGVWCEDEPRAVPSSLFLSTDPPAPDIPSWIPNLTLKFGR